MTPEAPASDRSIVGVNLRRFRAARKLSLATVAAEVGVSVATLSRVETNKQNVDVDLVVRLARFLGVTPAEVLGGSEPEDQDALCRSLSNLGTAERVRMFLAASGRRQVQEPAEVVEDLLLTLEVLRRELLQMQVAVRRRNR